jgi:rod shape-determining protein MreB
VGSDEFNESIMHFMKRKYNLLIGERTAEAINIQLGSAFPLDEDLSMDVSGRNLIEGIPKTVTIADDEIREALADSVSTIVNAVRVELARTPPEVSVAIIEGGIVLTGSGALLKKLGRRLEIETSLPVTVAEDPLGAVVMGAYRLLTDSTLGIKEPLLNPKVHELFKYRSNLTLMVRAITGIFSRDLAIDCGGANTKVYAKGFGILVSEPSTVAINRTTNAVEAVGREAKGMLGRTPANLMAFSPIKNGVITDSEIAGQMIRQFIRKAHNGMTWASPRVVMCVRSGLTKVERQAFVDTAYRAHAAEVYLVDEEMAAAIGVGFLITEPRGNMLVDIGASTTKIAVVALSGIVNARTVRVAGNEMDEAITRFIKRKYNLLIGERMAEAIKIGIGSAFPLDEQLSMDVWGRNLIEGIPKTVTITDDEIREALADSVWTIMKAVRVALERTSPELSADLVRHGIVLTGGGALLKGMDRRLSIETGLSVSIAEDCGSSVILGAGKMLSDIHKLRREAPA